MTFNRTCRPVLSRALDVVYRPDLFEGIKYEYKSYMNIKIIVKVSNKNFF